MSTVKLLIARRGTISYKVVSAGLDPLELDCAMRVALGVEDADETHGEGWMACSAHEQVAIIGIDDMGELFDAAPWMLSEWQKEQ